MEQTGYKIFKEDNRLTLVIDNPTSETVALIIQLFGAGIKDLTGLDPVKQEPMTVPSEKPVSEKEVAEPVTEQETKETATESQQVSETTPVLEADETVVKEESATEDEQSESEEEKKKQISGYSYQEICDIVKSNKKIVELGPVKIAVAIHPYLTEEEIKKILITCGKTEEELSTEEGYKLALSEVVNSKKTVAILANGYVRTIRGREKEK